MDAKRLDGVVKENDWNGYSHLGLFETYFYASVAFVSLFVLLVLLYSFFFLFLSIFLLAFLT